MIAHRTCSRCKATKELNEFFLVSRGLNRRRAACSACEVAARKANRKANPERERTYINDWRRFNREKVKAYNAAYYQRKKARLAQSK